MSILFGVLGIGIGLVVGVIFGLLAGGVMSSSLGEAEEYRQHFKVEILEYEKRGNQVYLKFRNDGDEPIDDLYFEIEVRGEDGKLKQEYEVQYSKWVAQGEIEETILKPFDLQMEPVDLDGEIRVQFKYGWRTVVDE